MAEKGITVKFNVPYVINIYQTSTIICDNEIQCLLNDKQVTVCTHTYIHTVHTWYILASMYVYIYVDTVIHTMLNQNTTSDVLCDLSHTHTVCNYVQEL